MSNSIPISKSPNFQQYFHGKKVLVTGAGKGIGRALSVELYTLGAQVYAVSRTLADLIGLESECPGIHTIELDLSNWKKTEQVLNEKLPGAMDVVINNAGLSGGSPFPNIEEDNLDSVFNVNLKAVVNVSQICAKKMILEGKEGDFVNISAISAVRAFSEEPVYCSSKAALDMMTKCMTIELAKHKIRANTISLGFVKTTDDPEDIQALETVYKDRCPMEKLWIPIEEVVRGVLFVASGSMSMLTGCSFTLDGGFLAF